MCKKFANYAYTTANPARARQRASSAKLWDLADQAGRARPNDITYKTCRP